MIHRKWHFPRERIHSRITPLQPPLDDIRRTHKPFSTRHRIITVQGKTRDVVVIGERLHDNTGEVVGTQGVYIDVTSPDQAQQAAITAAVTEFTENRAVIEQVKGVLMFVYRIDSDAAFELLKWRSHETNSKLRIMAEQLSEAIANMPHCEDLPHRTVFDRLLLTAHQRIRAKAAKKRP